MKNLATKIAFKGQNIICAALSDRKKFKYISWEVDTELHKMVRPIQTYLFTKIQWLVYRAFDRF